MLTLFTARNKPCAERGQEAERDERLISSAASRRRKDHGIAIA
jgi:hypothetical protein